MEGLTNTERDVLRREIKKRVVHGHFELPRGFSVDDMIDFLLYRKRNLVKKIQKKKNEPAWATKLLRKVDRAFTAFERFEEIMAEYRKKRVAKARKQLEYFGNSGMSTLLGSNTVPFDYQRLMGKGENLIELKSEAKRKLESVKTLLSENRAKKFVDQILQMTEKLPGADRHKAQIEAVKILEEKVREEAAKEKSEASEEEMGWLEEQEEEERRINEEAIREQERNRRFREKG